MNAIFTKCSPKRKYHKKPLCDNLSGICTFEKCRCFMAIKVPKNTTKIDEYLHHREKVIKRRREIELAKLDEENIGYAELKYADGTTWKVPLGKKGDIIKGEFAKRKELKAKYKRMMIQGFLILVGLVLLYPLVILIIDLL